MTSKGYLLLYTRNVTTDIVVWSLVLMGLMIVALAVVVRLKKKIMQADEAGAAGGFTLSDLRQLYKSGRMSADEFEKAKGADYRHRPVAGGPQRQGWNWGGRIESPAVRRREASMMVCRCHAAGSRPINRQNVDCEFHFFLCCVGRLR